MGSRPPMKAHNSRRLKKLRPGVSAHLHVLTESNLLIAIDREAERRSEEQGYPVRRSDVVTLALREWVKRASR